MRNSKVSKTTIFTGIAGIALLTTSVVPVFGWITGIIGAVLMGISIHRIGKVYNTGLMKYYISSVISFLAGIVLFSLSSTVFSKHAFIFCVATAYLLFLVSAVNGYKLAEKLAETTGIKSFQTAGILYMIGSLLSVLITGFVIIFSASGMFATGLWQMRKLQVHPER